MEDSQKGTGTNPVVDCLWITFSQGIGGATALLFAKEGASVVVSDLDEGKKNNLLCSVPLIRSA